MGQITKQIKSQPEPIRCVGVVTVITTTRNNAVTTTEYRAKLGFAGVLKNENLQKNER